MVTKQILKEAAELIVLGSLVLLHGNNTEHGLDLGHCSSLLTDAQVLLTNLFLPHRVG